MEAFSERLNELRQERNLSQLQLAKETGLSSSAIAFWELKKRTPNIEAVIILAKFFNVTVGYLAGTED